MMQEKTMKRKTITAILLAVPAAKNDTTKQQMEVKQQTHPQNAKFHSSKPVFFRQSVAADLRSDTE